MWAHLVIICDRRKNMGEYEILKILINSKYERFYFGAGKRFYFY